MRRVLPLLALAALAGCKTTTAPPQQIEAHPAPTATEVRVVPSHDSDPEAPRLVGVKAWLGGDGLHISATADRDAAELGDTWLADGSIRSREGDRTYYLGWNPDGRPDQAGRLYAYEPGRPLLLEVAVTKSGRHFEFTVPPALFMRSPNYPPAVVWLYVRALEASALYRFDVRGGGTFDGPRRGEPLAVDVD